MMVWWVSGGGVCKCRGICVYGGVCVHVCMGVILEHLIVSKLINV